MATLSDMRWSLGERKAEGLDVLSVHAEHADFVWRTLQRMGVRAADVEDQLQEVFVVVHHRLHTFDGSARMTTWLFGICLRVAAAYRRRAYRRMEQVVADVPEHGEGEGDKTPEQAAMEHEARIKLQAVLDLMDVEKRALFVMFELDELPCEEIATILGVPLGTVYSRLHAARRDFEKALKRVSARRAPHRHPPSGGRQ
jgi:RNA polymerase sigma-70 factor (ECF subfamily)